MSTIQKIRYSDCDPQGIVFNGNYARYWDDAMTDWFDELEDDGISLSELGIDVVTARLEIDFKSSATLRDILETRVTAEKLGNTSMTLQIETSKKPDDTVVALGKIVCVFVDRGHLRPVPVPDAFRAAVTEFEVTPRRA
ncbi:MAG TPA: thioesterase family protein [Acidimicrobiia bacterium]